MVDAERPRPEGVPEALQQPLGLRRPRRVVGARVGTSGRVARRPRSRLSSNGTSRSCHSASTWASSCARAALVVEPHVGGGTALVVVGLGRDPGPGVGLGHPRAAPAATPGSPRRRHDDDEVVGRAEVLLDEQRHVVHDDRVGGCRRDQLGGPGAHERVGDPLEVARACGVAEHERAERGPVERAVGRRAPAGRTVDDRGEAAVPGATTSRASGRRRRPPAPELASRADTVDLPEPMPPVRPTRSMSPAHGLRRPRAGPGSRRWRPGPSGSA